MSSPTPSDVRDRIVDTLTSAGFDLHVTRREPEPGHTSWYLGNHSAPDGTPFLIRIEVTPAPVADRGFTPVTSIEASMAGGRTLAASHEESATAEAERRTLLANDPDRH